MYNILLLCWLPVLTFSLGNFLGQCGIFPLPQICLPSPPTCYSEVQQIESFDNDCCEAVCRGLSVPSGCPDCAIRRKPRKRIKKRPRRAIKRFKPTVDNEQPRIDDYDFDKRPLADLDYHKSQDDDTCNSENIRNIIKRGTGTKTSIFKRNIQNLVEKELEDQFNVVCGKGQFSYITTTDEFCQETVDDTTCYVFKRNKIDDF